MASPFDPPFDQLPPVIPIFPLTGVLLLPRGRLPLNIFEPRYLAMTADALAGHRIIGMVQPQEARDDNGGDQGEPPVYRTGCAGRLTAFSETDDGRYLITLTGIARFDIVEELPLQRGYRPVRADWSRYRGDFAPAAAGRFDRDRFLAALKPFFTRHNISADWDSVTKSQDERLITTIAMVCPFAPSEKQALLEAESLDARAKILTTLVEMASAAGASPAERRDMRH